MNSNKLSRKDFLFRSGAILTVPVFLKYCSSADYPRLSGKSGDDPLLNSGMEGYAEPALKAINFGITAPNAHNTQAWKFRILNPNEFLLFVDEKRILPVTDITTRQIHISQGTFLEIMKIGSRGFGYNTDIKFFPEGEYPISEIGKRPVAKISLSPAGKNSAGMLFKEIKNRATNRTKYEGALITIEESVKILEQATPMNTKTSFVLSEETMKPYIDLFYESMKLETKNIRLADESRTWFRFSDKEIQEKRDGIALPGNGVTGFTRWMAETFFIGPEPEKFHDPKGTDVFMKRYKENIESAKGIVYWQTKTNGLKDWVLAGMDYARFQLAITGMGFVMHPMSQILQEYPEMQNLQKKFDLLTGISAPSKIQMIVRIGRSDFRYMTPRRNLRSMLL